MKRPHLPAVTGLRFLAAMHVVFFHSTRQWVGWRARLIDAGPSAVSLFFVLSGFVLAYTYLDGTPVHARAFWRARFARVYPVYILGVLLTAPFFLAMMSQFQHIVRWYPPATAAATVLLVQAWHPAMACQINCPGWSLSAEAFFYLVFPVLGAIFARRSPRQLFVISAGLWIVSLETAAIWARFAAAHYPGFPAVFQGYDDRFFMYNPLIRLPEFLIGVAAGRMFLMRESRDVEARGWGVAAVVSFGAIIWVCVAWPKTLFPLLHNGLLVPAYVLLIYSLAMNRGPLAWVLGSRVGVTLGEWSYALYVLHIPVAVAFGNLAQEGFVTPEWHSSRPLLGLAERLAFTLFVSYLTFRYLERPARAYFRSRGGGQRQGERAPDP